MSMTLMLERIKKGMDHVQITKAYISILSSPGQTMLHSPHDQTLSIQHQSNKPKLSGHPEPIDQYNIVTSLYRSAPRLC
jgi:hypothetical protein